MANTPINIAGLLPFNYLLSSLGQRAETVHFFLDDYQFAQRLDVRSEYWAGQLKRVNGALAPDYSVLVEMPEYVQLWQVARQRAVMAYWQSCDIRVIPTLQWAEEETLEWCFSGLERCEQVAVSSVGVLGDALSTKLFELGFEVAMRIISPREVIWYGNRIPGIEDRRIRYFEPFQRRFEHGRKR